MILFFAFITNMSQILFLHVANESDEDTYEGIVDEVLGKYGSW